MDLKKFFPDLSRMLRPAFYEDGTTPKARNSGEGERKKTKKGATHKQGKVFRGRRLSSVLTPAMYRKFHFGIGRKAKERLEKKK